MTAQKYKYVPLYLENSSLQKSKESIFKELSITAASNCKGVTARNEQNYTSLLPNRGSYMKANT
jgi:hypothetical protein